MKIIHLLSTTTFSGAENVVCQIIKMFENDNEYEMFYCSPSGKISEVLQEKKIRFIPINKMNYNNLKKVIKDLNPDVIHAHDVKASILASLFAGKCKVISHIHGNSIEMRKVSLKSIMYLLSTIRFKYIFWVSKSCLDDFKYKSFVEKKSKVLVNVIDTDRIIEMGTREDNVKEYDIIFVGRLVDIKNPIRLLEIVKKVTETKPNVSLGVIGDGTLFDDMQNYINANGLNKNVDLLGFQNNPYKYIRKSKIMLLTSIYEGTPMCVLEAMAFGKPIVSTRIDGLKDIVIQGYNGYLSNDNKEIIMFIIELISDSHKLEIMSHNVLTQFRKINDIKKYKNILKEKYSLE